MSKTKWAVRDRADSATTTTIENGISAQKFPYAIDDPSVGWGELLALIPAGDEAEANTRLIANAPMMLALLKSLVPQICQYCRKGRLLEGSMHTPNAKDNNSRECEATDLREAIARAEGKE